MEVERPVVGRRPGGEDGVLDGAGLGEVVAAWGRDIHLGHADVRVNLVRLRTGRGAPHCPE
jgi:hypothetical protein